MNDVQIRNNSEGRSVGFFNYKISSNGKGNIESALRKMILNNSPHMIYNQSTSGKFKKFRVQAEEIKELKINWNKRLSDLQEQGYPQKDILNTFGKSKVPSFRIFKKNNEFQSNSLIQNK